MRPEWRSDDESRAGQAHDLADLRSATPIRNLFLTGQDVSTCGVMGALAGAIATASAVVGRNLFGTLASHKGTRTVTEKRAA
jgi:hypothetical protein